MEMADLASDASLPNFCVKQEGNVDEEEEQDAQIPFAFVAVPSGSVNDEKIDDFPDDIHSYGADQRTGVHIYQNDIFDTIDNSFLCEGSISESTEDVKVKFEPISDVSEFDFKEQKPFETVLDFLNSENGPSMLKKQSTPNANRLKTGDVSKSLKAVKVLHCEAVAHHNSESRIGVRHAFEKRVSYPHRVRTVDVGVQVSPSEEQAPQSNYNKEVNQNVSALKENLVSQSSAPGATFAIGEPKTPSKPSVQESLEEMRKIEASVKKYFQEAQRERMQAKEYQEKLEEDRRRAEMERKKAEDERMKVEEAVTECKKERKAVEALIDSLKQEHKKWKDLGVLSCGHASTSKRNCMNADRMKEKKEHLGSNVWASTYFWHLAKSASSKYDWVTYALLALFGAEAKYYRVNNPRNNGDGELRRIPDHPPYMTVLAGHYLEFLNMNKGIASQPPKKERGVDEDEIEKGANLTPEQLQRRIMQHVKELPGLIGDKALQMHKKDKEREKNKRLRRLLPTII